MKPGKSRDFSRLPNKPREPGSLKEATALLIQACGGLDRSANLVRVGRSTVARYSDPADDVSYIPADVIRALELNCAEPIVTRYLAAEQGCSLSCVKYDPTPQALAEDVAALARDCAELMGDSAKAISAAQGEVSPSERGRLTADIDRTIAVLFHMRGRLAEGRG
jgi:hypothetical protein